MKKILFGSLVLVFVGILGILARPLTFPVLDWIGKRPDAARQWYEDRIFSSQSGAAIRCANDALEYSTIVGIDRTKNRGIRIATHILQDYTAAGNEAITRSILEQVITVIRCADEHIEEWSTVMIGQIDLSVINGYSRDGKESGVIGTSLIWTLSMDRDIGRLFGHALDSVVFFRSANADGRMNFAYLAMFGPIPVGSPWLDGDLVVKTGERFVQYVDDAKAWRAEQGR